MTISKREALTATSVRSYPRGEDWRDRASCVGLDVNDFVPDQKGEQIPAQIRRICLGCPSVQPCLDYAIAHNIRDGVWGATSPRERRGLTIGDSPPILANQCGDCGGQLYTPRARTCNACMDRREDARNRARRERNAAAIKEAS